MKSIREIIQLVENAISEAPIDPKRDPVAIEFAKLVSNDMSSVGVDLPKLISMTDYHEVQVINEMLKDLGIAARAVEVGFDENSGVYYALVVAAGTTNTHKLISMARQIIDNA